MSSQRRLDEEVDELRAQLAEQRRFREQKVAELEMKLTASEKVVEKMKTDLMLGLEAAAKEAEEAKATAQQQEEEVSDLVLHMEQSGKMAEGAAKMALKVQEELRSTRSTLQGEVQTELSRLAEDLRREMARGLEGIRSELLEGLGRGEATAKKFEETAQQRIDTAMQELNEARAEETQGFMRQCMESAASSAAQVADVQLKVEEREKAQQRIETAMQEQEGARAREVAGLRLKLEESANVADGAAKMAAKLDGELKASVSTLQGELQADLGRLAEEIRKELSASLEGLTNHAGSEAEAAAKHSADIEKATQQRIETAMQEQEKARSKEVAELRLKLEDTEQRIDTAMHAAKESAKLDGELKASVSTLQGELQADLGRLADEIRKELSAGLEGLTNRDASEAEAAAKHSADIDKATQQRIETAMQEQEKARATEVAELWLKLEESAKVADAVAKESAKLDGELKASVSTLQGELQADLGRLAEEIRSELSAGLEGLAIRVGSDAEAAAKHSAEAKEAASKQANTADRAAEMVVKAHEELRATRSALQEELQEELVHVAEEFRGELSLGLEGLASRLGEEAAAAARRAEEAGQQRSDAASAQLKEALRAEADAREALRAELTGERDARDAESAGAARQLQEACAAAASFQTNQVEWSIQDCLRQLAPPPEGLPPIEAEPGGPLLEEEAARRWFSPPFEAAGASGLRLELCTRRRAGDGGSPRKDRGGSPSSVGSPKKVGGSSADGGAGLLECSAFLHAPAGLLLDFRLFIGGESLSLAHSFGNGAAGRCGSEQLGALGEHVSPEDGSLRLGVEIVRATWEARAAAPEGAQHLAGAVVSKSCVNHGPREAAAGAPNGHKVRRVQWRVDRDSALLQRFSRGEAMRSAVFEAGGIQGLQMVFYPKGCEGAKEGFCSLFLARPHWANVRCWLRAGRWKREGRPELAGVQDFLGRVNFCRLQDCLGPGSSVVELAMEVQEVPVGHSCEPQLLDTAADADAPQALAFPQPRQAVDALRVHAAQGVPLPSIWPGHGQTPDDPGGPNPPAGWARPMNVAATTVVAWGGTETPRLSNSGATSRLSEAPRPSSRDHGVAVTKGAPRGGSTRRGAPYAYASSPDGRYRGHGRRA